MKKKLLPFLLIFFPLWCLAQLAPGKYFVEFTDKSDSPFSIDHPLAFLSQRAIDRRTMQRIAITTGDFPVNPSYIQGIRQTGAQVIHASRWFNGAIIGTHNPAVIAAIDTLPYVKRVVKSKVPSQASKMKIIKQDSDISEEKGNPRILNKEQKETMGQHYAYGESYRQVNMLNGVELHNRGLTGKGMVIAVLDAGFFYVDSIAAFDSLRARHGILGTRDFVSPGSDVYRGDHHGMYVLSLMGGNLPGELIGTAPGASYWLLRTEDADSEYIVEEYNWVCAAEFADSVGADVINSSLGYTQFNDSTQNHTCDDMNGNTTPVTRGANIAASKGMVIVNSAGNSGGKPWKCISAPSDGFDVLCIAAVDSNDLYAPFSSWGRIAGNYVKPDVAAQGARTVVASTAGGTFRNNGTSFSSPLTAGLVACLWQAFPGTNNQTLLRTVRESASQYDHPDTLIGYGIPDFLKAYETLKSPSTNDRLIKVYPLPFRDVLNLEFYSSVDQDISIEAYDMLGNLVFSKDHLPCVQGMTNIRTRELETLRQGQYILKITSGKMHATRRIVKLSVSLQ